MMVRSLTSTDPVTNDPTGCDVKGETLRREELTEHTYYARHTDGNENIVLLLERQTSATVHQLIITSIVC